MAWGIMMTGLTLVGMLGLMILGISAQENPTKADSREGASTKDGHSHAA